MKKRMYVVGTPGDMSPEMLRKMADAIEKDPKLKEKLKTISKAPGKDDSIMAVDGAVISSVEPANILSPASGANSQLDLGPKSRRKVKLEFGTHQLYLHNDPVNNIRNVFQVIRGVLEMPPELVMRCIYDIERSPKSRTVIAVDDEETIEMFKQDFEKFGLVCTIEPVL